MAPSTFVSIEVRQQKAKRAAGSSRDTANKY